ncbi:amidohydrolase family protein [Caballeronia sp. LP006]|jgi:cytosine/adenosine deaminase-related metal-dependent hydrolase|uniref:amidohydrolase family protein n=1 Tax=Caballeronia sp. LP006 TaxID=3038552 RepID=UPI002860E782|nr:amidohydrolase family protein [Caballeronia sp. LP006]MDR5831693.1 amidohydrolase family protein [Caballeronia sp. LP006]
MEPAIWIIGARAFGGDSVDVCVRARTIDSIAPHGEKTPAARDTVVDGAGMLLLPGFVEGHTHLDKTTWGMPWYRNAVGPLLVDRIENERRWRAESGHDAAEASRALALAFLRQGTTRIRTHVDIDTDAGLRHLEGVAATRAALADVLDMQIVAFPQSGVTTRAGTRELLDTALRSGADVLGALDPAAIDGDPALSLDITFALATKHDKPIDIHLHEPGDLGAFTFDLLLDRVKALGFEGRVVVSHAFCLGQLPDARRHALLERIARLNVALLTTAPASVAVPPFREARAAGVTLFGGNDGIRDTWTPFGSPDMLERAMLIAMRFDLRRDDDLAAAFACVSSEAARGCGFADYGLAAGMRADLVLVDAETVAQAVAMRPARRFVMSNGTIIPADFTR